MILNKMKAAFGQLPVFLHEKVAPKVTKCESSGTARAKRRGLDVGQTLQPSLLFIPLLLLMMKRRGACAKVKGSWKTLANLDTRRFR